MPPKTVPMKDDEVIKNFMDSINQKLASLLERQEKIEESVKHADEKLSQFELKLEQINLNKEKIARIDLDVDYLKRQYQNLNESQNKIEEKMKDLDEKVKKIDLKSEQVEANTQKIESHSVDISLAKTQTMKNDSRYINENAKLLQKIEDLENRMRRKNLIISGLEESEVESWSESEQKVKVIFNSTLKIDVAIERAHRIGRKIPKKSRSIIVLLTSYKDKMLIYRNCHLLKGLNIYVNDDVSQAVRDQRKELIKFAKKEFPNERFKIRFNKLLIGSRTFVNGHVGVHELNVSAS